MIHNSRFHNFHFIRKECVHTFKMFVFVLTSRTKYKTYPIKRYHVRKSSSFSLTTKSKFERDLDNWSVFCAFRTFIFCNTVFHRKVRFYVQSIRVSSHVARHGNRKWFHLGRFHFVTEKDRYIYQDRTSMTKRCLNVMWQEGGPDFTWQVLLLPTVRSRRLGGPRGQETPSHLHSLPGQNDSFQGHRKLPHQRSYDQGRKLERFPGTIATNLNSNKRKDWLWLLCGRVGVVVVVVLGVLWRQHQHWLTHFAHP